MIDLEQKSVKFVKTEEFSSVVETCLLHGCLSGLLSNVGDLKGNECV